MKKDRKTISWIKINEKYILIISDSYKGLPLIAYIPDYIIISRKIYEKYKNSTFIVNIPEEKIFFI